MRAMIPFQFSRPLVKLFACVTLCGAFLAISLAAAVAAAAEVPYQDFKSNVCAHALCTIDFAPPPAGKRLAITHVSCNFVTKGNAKIVESDLALADSSNANNGLLEFIVPTLVSTGSVLGNIYAANHATLIYVPPTFHLRGRLSVAVTNGETISCMITGTVQTP